MRLIRERLQEFVQWLAVLAAILRFPLINRAEDTISPGQRPAGFRTQERVTLVSASTAPAGPPNGFRADRITLRPSPLGDRAAAPETRGQSLLPQGRKTSAVSGARLQVRNRPAGFRTSGPGMTDDATREVQESRVFAQALPPANGATTPPDGMPPRGDLPSAPGQTLLPGEGLILVPEMPPPSTRKPLFRGLGAPLEPEVETARAEDEEERPKEEPLHTPKPWPVFESPVFGTEEITEFTQQIVSAGRWSLRPTIGLGLNYDGNVFISNTDVQKDLVVRIMPGLLFSLGNDMTPLLIQAGYLLNAGFYLNQSSEDAFDQAGRIDVSWRLAKLTLGLRLGVDSATVTSIDASGRVNQNSYYAGVSGRYELNEKFSFDLGCDYRTTRVQGLIGATQIRVPAYVNYQYSPKLTVGIGGLIGIDQVQYGSDQTYQELALRAVFATTAKLTVTADVGVEFRQFADGGANAVRPVFALEARWAVREGTNVALRGLQRINNSAVLDDQNYTSTAFLASIQQRLTDRFDLFFTGGYENLAYSSAGPGVTATRDDHAFLLRAGIQWHSLAWLNVGLYYEYSQDNSSGGGDRSFTRDRIGTQINLVF